MDSAARQAALDAIDAQEIVTLTRGLIDVPSPTGHEVDCARFLCGYMQEQGVEAHIQEIEEGRANVVAMLPGDGDGPTLMLNGHLDTSYYGDDRVDYPVVGIPKPNDKPQSFEIDGGVYGLGAYNMKGGVGSAFSTLVALKRAGVRLPGTVMASGVSGESEKAPVRALYRDFIGPAYRGAGFGSRYLLMHCNPVDYAIVAEPSELYIGNAQAGYLFVKVVVWGEGTGTGLKYQGRKKGEAGVSAIERAVDLMQAINDWAPEYANKHRYDTGMGIMDPFVTIGAIEAGWPFFASLLAAVAHVYVNVRVTPVMTATQGLAELDECLHNLVRQQPGFRYELEVYASNAPSTCTPVDSLLVRLGVEVMEQRIGLPTRPFGPGQANPSNDTNTFRRHGIPAIKCGPTTRLEPNAAETNKLHGRHVYRDDLVAATRFYTHMAFELCSRTQSELAALETKTAV